MDQPSFEESSMQDVSESEYKNVIKYLQAQYQEAQKKLVDRENQIQMLIKGKGFEGKDNFEIENKTYQFRSQINDLKYNFMLEKEEMILQHQKEMTSLLEEYQYKLQAEKDKNQAQFDQLVEEINTRNELIKEIQSKPAQIMEQLVDLGHRNDQQQQENQALKNIIKQMTKQIESLKGKSKESNRKLDEVQETRKQNIKLKQSIQNSKKIIEQAEMQINKLKAQLVNLKSEGQKMLLLNKDKLFYANEEVERYKKLLETYKALNADKQSQIHKLSQEIMNMQLQRTKKTQTVAADQDKVVQKLHQKIKQLTQQLSHKQFSSNEATLKNEQQNHKLYLQLKQRQDDLVSKVRQLQKLKELFGTQDTQLRRLSKRQKQLLQDKKEIKNTLLSKQQQIMKLKTQLNNSLQGNNSQQYLVDQLNIVQNQLSETKEKLKVLSKEKKSPNRKDDNQLKTLKSNYEKLQSSYDELKDQLSIIQQQNQEKQSNLQSTLRQNKQLIDNKKKIQQEISNLQKALRELKYQNEKIKQSMDTRSVSGISVYKDENENLQHINVSLKQDLQKQKSKLRAKQQQLVGLRLQLSKTVHQKDIIMLKITQLQAEKQGLQGKFGNQKEYFKAESNKYSSVIQSLRKSLQQIKNQNLVLKTNLEQVTFDKSNLMNETQLAKSRLKQMQALKRKYQISQQSIKNNNDQLSKQIHQLTMDIQQKQQNIRSQQRTNDLEKQKLNSKIKKLETQLSSKKSLSDELELANDKILELERTLILQSEKNAMKNTDIRKKPLTINASPQISKYKVEIQELSRQNQELYMKAQAAQKSQQTMRKDILNYKKQLNLVSNSDEVNKQKIEEQTHQISELKTQIEILKRQKNQLVNEKKRESLILSEQISQLTYDNQQLNKMKEKLENQLNKVKSSLSNASKDYKKSQNLGQQQLQILKLQREDLEDKLQQMTKLRAIEQLKSKKILDELSTSKQQSEELRAQYERVYQQCQNQKAKNTKQIKSFQQMIEKMNEKLLIQKKEYQLKNASIFKNQTSLYNQINNANQQIDKLHQQKQQLLDKLNKLIQNNNSIEAALIKNTQDNVKLRQEMKQRQQNSRKQIVDNDDRGKDSRTKVFKHNRQEQMVAQLETKFKQVQEMNIRLRKQMDQSPRSKQPNSNQLLQLKVEYSQLLNEYNKLQDKHQELKHAHSELSIEYEKYKRKTTKQLYDTRINDSEEMRNLYQQTQVLNTLLTQKDKQIQSLKSIASKMYSKPQLYPQYPSYSRQYVQYQGQPVRDLGGVKPQLKEYHRVYPVQIPSHEVVMSSREGYPKQI